MLPSTHSLSTTELARVETATEPCACGSGLTEADCCAPALRGVAPPPTAEALMRSRYSAYVAQNDTYLLQSWHPDTRPAGIDFDPQQHWLGLKVLRVEAGGADDHAGIVEFIARYKIAGKGHRLHEVSRFNRVAGQWRYVDGQPGASNR